MVTWTRRLASEHQHLLHAEVWLPLGVGGTRATSGVCVWRPVGLECGALGFSQTRAQREGARVSSGGKRG